MKWILVSIAATANVRRAILRLSTSEVEEERRWRNRDGVVELYKVGPRMRAGCLFWLCLLLLVNFVSAQMVQSKEGEFVTIATVGLNSTSKETAAAITSDTNGNFYFTGTTDAFDRGGESDLVEGDDPALRGKDIFIAKLSASSNQIEWVIRTGTSGDDEGHDIAVDPLGASLYVVGRTNGQFGSSPRKGQSDAFLLKYDIRGPGKPTRAWSSPLTVGTSGSEEAAEVAVDSARGFVYVVGYTRGELFPSDRESARGSDWDAFIFRCRESDGSIDAGRQFGTVDDDIAKRLLLPADNGDFLLVGVETLRKVGNVGVKNMNVFRLRVDDLTIVSSFLVKTYSPETIAGLSQHPLFPETNFIGGSSWLSSISGWDFAVKSLSNLHEKDAIVDVGSLGPNEYARRRGSIDDADDIAVSMKLNAASGRLWIAGTTSGKMTETVVLKGDSQIVLAAIEPESGMATLVSQDESTESTFTSIAGFTFSADSLTIIYVATRLDLQDGNLYAYIGTFGIPETARAAIAAPAPTPSPASTPPPSEERQTSEKKSFGSMPIIIGGAVGGVVVVLTIIVALCAVCRTKKKSEGLKAGRNRQPPPKKNGQREKVRPPPPVALPARPPPSKGRTQPNASGLI